MNSLWRAATELAGNNARKCALSLWLLLALVATALLFWDHRREMHAKEAAARTMTALVAAHVDDGFKLAGLTLDDVAQYIEERQPAEDDPVLRARMIQRTQVTPFLRAVYVVGLDGYVAHDTDYPLTPRISLEDRPYFRQHLVADHPPRAVSGPFLSRSGQGWFLVMTRRIGPPERPLGVAAAAFRLAYFEDLHRRLQLPADTEIFLFQDDGVLLAQHPSKDAEVGRSYRDMPLFRRYLPVRDTGAFRASGPPLNYERHVTYERLAARGVVVGLVQRLEESMASWRRAAALVAVAMLLLLLLLLFVAGQLERAAAERVRVRDRLHRSEKMEALGQLTGGIAHDFGNLLGIVQTNLEVLRRLNGTEVKAAQAISRATRAVDNGAEMIRQLLSFGRRRDLVTEPTDLNTLLRAIQPLLQQAASSHLVQVDLCDGPTVSVLDRCQLEVALINLVINARDAMDHPGVIVLRTRHETRPAPVDMRHRRPGICLSVEDDGCGMPAEVKARAMEPFFTTKGEKGTGLGLAQVFMLVTQFGGDMSIESRPGEGTCIQLWLPAHAGGQQQ